MAGDVKNDMSNINSTPAELSLEDLRAERDRLRNIEDAVSFVRRLAQGRIDLVTATLSSRRDGTGEISVADIVRSGVGPAPGKGSVRPPRETNVEAHHPLLIEFESLCERLGFDDMTESSVAELEALEAGLRAFEAEQSEIRKTLFGHIDAFTAELVERYKSGAASVDALLDS